LGVCRVHPNDPDTHPSLVPLASVVAQTLELPIALHSRHRQIVNAEFLVFVTPKAHHPHRIRRQGW
jgi:hypothetical protein